MTKIEKSENNGSPVASTDDAFDQIIASHKEKRIVSLCNNLHKRVPSIGDKIYKSCANWRIGCMLQAMKKLF